MLQGVFVIVGYPKIAVKCIRCTMAIFTKPCTSSRCVFDIFIVIPSNNCDGMIWQQWQDDEDSRFPQGGIVDASGKAVHTLVDKYLPVGKQMVTFHPNPSMSAGTYYVLVGVGAFHDALPIRYSR